MSDLSLNLSYHFTVDYGTSSIKTAIAIKPSNNNRQTALDTLEAAILAATGKAKPDSKGTLTSKDGVHKYVAGPFSVTNLAADIIDAFDKGRITLDNLVERPLEEYLSYAGAAKLLESKEAALAVLPDQIAELKRVLPLIAEREESSKPVKEYGLAFKARWEQAELSLNAEREAREAAESQLAAVIAKLSALEANHSKASKASKATD